MKNIFMTMICTAIITSCTSDGVFDIGYGIRGGYNVDRDFALGSHISKAKADSEWKDCYQSYLLIKGTVIYSDYMEKCMTDKGLIRLSEIRRRQKQP